MTTALRPATTGIGGKTSGADSKRGLTTGLKPKDLVGIPWRLAFALQADGWFLAQRHRVEQAEPDARVGDRPADEGA